MTRGSRLFERSLINFNANPAPPCTRHVGIVGWVLVDRLNFKIYDLQSFVAIFLRLRNMLLKATFKSSYFGLVEATSAALKECVRPRTQR